MKRRILLSCIALCSAMLGVVAQRGYTFNAVALNVDGLPNQEINAIVTTVNLNPDGKNEDGATELCGILANSGWDIVGFSEDFNYHSYLAAAPASTYYNFGKHSGSITTNITQAFTRAEIDGLGLAVVKHLNFSGDTNKGLQEKWNEEYGGKSWDLANTTGNGVGKNGADEMITKGYRMYTITFDEDKKVAIDVYILHMDAGTADEGDDDDLEDGKDRNVKAREAQLTQLATAIKTNIAKNKRPVIVLGDTNCRYTRETLKTGFIDVINAVNGLTIKDAWVELIWDGVYPTYGAGSMMTDAYGAQRGEVVDKVFYINTTESNLKLKANSYLNDESVKVSDHTPIVVNFTLTDPNGTPEDVELEGPAGEVVLTDKAPTAPTVGLAGTFYLRNVATGLYLKVGGSHSSHAVEGVHAMPMTFNKVDNDTYYITHTIPNCYLGDNLYLDNGARADWDIKEIVRSDDAKKYILCIGNNALSSTGKGKEGEEVQFASYNASDTKQHWMLYTADMIKEELKETLKGTFYNASTLIPYGRVDRQDADTRKELWKGAPAFSGWASNSHHCMEKHFWGGENQQFDVYQEITGLPQGTYTLTAQAFHRSGDHGTSVTTVLPDLYATNGSSKTFTTKVCSVNDASAPATKPNNMTEAGAAFVNGSYNVTLSNVTVNSDGKLRIGVKNTSSDNSARMWVCFNNFQLLYHGTATGDLKGSELYKGIKAAVEEAQALIATQSAEVQAAFDISAVVYRYNNNLISADGAWEYAAIDNAVRTPAKLQTAVGADMSLAIANPSFETGDLTGWTVLQTGWDTGANSGQDAQGMVGEYLFNTWAGETYGCGVIYQDITGLRNGHYVLQAMVTSWAERKAYIVANNQHVGVATTVGEGVFVDLSLDFLVEDGIARIGAVGGNENGDFYYKQGIFYKADNFRLTYKGTVGEGRVKIALADAKAKADKLHEGAKSQFNTAVAKYENATVKGDGKAEEAAIYNALKAAIATQPRTETDMTWMITNPGFETGDWTGWTTVYGWDSRVAHATSDVAPNNGEGQYIMNTWNDFVDAKNSGINAPVRQTLSGLPNGRYRLTADVTSDNGNPVAVYATTNSETVNDTIQPTNNKTFKTKSIEFDVTDHTATIGAVGYKGGVNGTFNLDGGCWYKCDNFRLTYLGHELSLDQGNENAVSINDWYTSVDVTRSITAGKWSTFVGPFNMANPDGWEVKKLDSSGMTGDVISLTFVEADAIEAGVPYMVRKREGESVSIVSTMNVQVDTKLTTPETNEVQFVGVYEKGTIPVGAFFISDNTFYQAADGTNTIKAFRAYFQPVNNGAKARSLRYRMGDGEDEDDVTTAIDTLDEEVSVVGIYTTGGVRINDMQEGVNILQMSNGSTMKVIIK